MKKEERLYRLLGDIDDDLVADATRKGVWMPLVAAAACVALTIGLWQGGVFTPAHSPLETPDESTATEEITEPYILVGGEENSDPMDNDRIPTLNDRLVSPALEEKMKEYRDVNAVFQVIAFCAHTVEDDDERYAFIKANEEYQSLLKQYKKARKAEKSAGDHLHESRVNNNAPAIQATLTDEYLKAKKTFDDLSYKLNRLREELSKQYYDALEKERILYAAKYSKTEPIYGYGRFGNGYYMELTADAINELADRGGYYLYLAGEKIELDRAMED